MVLPDVSGLSYPTASPHEGGDPIEVPDDTRTDGEEAEIKDLTAPFGSVRTQAYLDKHGPLAPVELPPDHHVLGAGEVRQD